MQDSLFDEASRYRSAWSWPIQDGRYERRLLSHQSSVNEVNEPITSGWWIRVCCIRRKIYICLIDSRPRLRVVTGQTGELRSVRGTSQSPVMNRFPAKYHYASGRVPYNNVERVDSFLEGRLQHSLSPTRCLNPPIERGYRCIVVAFSHCSLLRQRDRFKMTSEGDQINHS